MVPGSWLRGLAAIAIGLVCSACGPQIHSKPPAVTPALVVTTAPPPAPAPVPPPEDPVAVLIATSQRRFAAGQHELELGHLERAKDEFNEAVHTLLESPYGARSDPRLREQFDRLVDRISTYEITALSVGDGFTEKKYDTASLDELLSLSTFEQPAAPAELKQAVATDLQSTDHDIPIPLNAQVLSYIQLFQGKLRSWIEEGLKRGARYLPMIQNVFRAEGLPLDLAYVPLIESAFNPDAVSRAKAKGVWQFMGGTALENGLRHDWYIDERADPEKATLAAAKYLRTLNGIFAGDWHLALASYNGGPGTVQRAMVRTRLNDFWKLAGRPRLLPRETREYVPMILAAIVIARNPAQYGLDIVADEPMTYEKVAMPGPVDLRRVAEWTGVSVDDIQTLNPELRRWTTPVNYQGYALKVPAGTAAVVQEHLQQADTAELASLRWYTVKRGDTLTTIARKLSTTLGVTVKATDLAGANNLLVRAVVTPGQQLIIPCEATPMLAARIDRPVPVTASRPVVPPDHAVAQAPDAQPSEEAKLIYQVKRGDTLFGIAQLFRTSVDSLKLWNHLRTNVINPGDHLTIFTKRLSLPPHS
jgi:membrane-bound lytic murein transglycosylase D